MNELLIVVHVPKTAGTTLRAIMARTFSQQFLFKGYSGEHVRELKFQFPAEHPCALIGHFPFGLHRRLSRPCRYFTMVRDPVHQVLSHYNHLVNSTDPAQVRVMTAIHSFEDFVALPWAANLQTEYLSGYSRTQLEAAPEQALECAKRNIEEHFLGVGVTERFDESLLFLAHHLRWNWRNLLYLPENTSRERRKRLCLADVSAQTVARIRTSNSYDAALHEHANRLLDGQVAAIPHFPRDLATFRMLNCGARPALLLAAFAQRAWRRCRGRPAPDPDTNP